MPSIFLINGPNLNLLGKREPRLYGRDTLKDIVARCEAIAKKNGMELKHFQSNHEGEIIEALHAARDEHEGIVINPAAFTHTSVAILDALHAFKGPVVEVHISNLHQREAFRQTSYVSQRAEGVIMGCGAHGYELAMQHIARLLRRK